jgi:hypothetical protein
MSYTGHPYNTGGAQVRPDLAARKPLVSSSGLTWTFRIKPGLHYAPPLQDVEITSPDFVRALEREADPDVTKGFPYDYTLYYSVIQGFDEYRSGKATTISGLLTPTDHTLVVRLTEPAGDLGYRLSLPATAPIPPNPFHRAPALGVAQGHDGGYGRFLVASGPYMIEGAADLDFSRAPDHQRPVSGYKLPILRPVGPNDFEAKMPGALSLVRNPSWDRETDGLRGAYVRGILLQIGKRSGPGLLRRTLREDVPWFDTGPPRGVQLHFLSNPQLKGRVKTGLALGTAFVAMNLAVPPFDDLRVRKAVYLAIDRGRLEALQAAANFPGTVPGHLIPDSMEEGLLLDKSPSWASRGTGSDIRAARREMRRSRYDHNHDGVCDRVACRAVSAGLTGFNASKPIERSVRDDLRAIGIHLRLGDDINVFEPASGAALVFVGGFFSDYPNASGFLPFIASHPQGGFDWPLLGSTPAQLQQWGYHVAHVRNENDRLNQCTRLIGPAQVKCWAELDKFLTDHVVAWVPWSFGEVIRVIGTRVSRFSYDQFTGLPALDQIALKRGSS